MCIADVTSEGKEVEKVEATPVGEPEAQTVRRKTRLEKEAECFAGHASQVRKYSQSPRSPNEKKKTNDFSNPAEMEEADMGDKKEDLGYMRFLSGEAKLKMQVTRNFDAILDHKRKRIEETSKPIDLFYRKCRKQFDSADQDLIDKAERYFETKLDAADRWAEYETDPEVLRLISFCEWAKKRGGVEAFGAMKDIRKDEVGASAAEKKKPYWKRTYQFAGQDVKLETKFIESKVLEASYVADGNAAAYLDHKRGALFPRGKLGDRLIESMPAKQKRIALANQIETKGKIVPTGPIYKSEIEKTEEKQHNLLMVFKSICEGIRTETKGLG